MSKVILVTGANTGIGFELVRLLAAQGHTVYLGARNPDAGATAQTTLVNEGLTNVKFVLIDLNDIATIEAAKETIEKEEGKLDVLVNNAGISKFEDRELSPLTVKISSIRATMETNLFGTIQVTQTFLPLLRKAAPGSVILNVSTEMASNSWMAARNFGHWIPYNASKAATNSFAISLAKELEPEGIKVNAVTPGYTSTKLNFFGQGGKSAKAGAECLLPFALLDKDGPTCANTGIGFELVRLLATKGHKVYLGARNPAAGAEAQATLAKEGLTNVKSIQLDLNDISTIHAAKAIIAKEEGKLDVLVNNAGISKMEDEQTATTVKIASIRETMETNLYGTIEVTQAFLPLLRNAAPGSVILNVSTDMASNHWMATHNFGHWVAYNTSKAALNSFGISLAKELEPEGIKVNAVTPGYTSTKLNFFGQGGKSVADGAKTLLPWALIDKDGPTCKFFDEHGNELEW
ncbi:hypothetical protein CVT24_009277 [Panaeolus cyanescens]|uniref:NAD(P)-binding protein n=1 Tax=Panaeolus cyanescens TaxID=181874 RepID=A0A409Y8D6_9AGAR|nr:hypothetical protein CVT24_009277 [Panaeolus cyanescens]